MRQVSAGQVQRFAGLGNLSGGLGATCPYPPDPVTWLHSQGQAAFAASKGENPPDYIIKDFVNHNAALPMSSTNPADSKALRLKEAAFYRQAAAVSGYDSWSQQHPGCPDNAAGDIAYATKVEALMNAGGDFTAGSEKIDAAIQKAGQPVPAPSATPITTPATLAAAGMSNTGLYVAIGGGVLLLLGGVVYAVKKKRAKKMLPSSSPVVAGLGSLAWRRCHNRASTPKQHRACMRKHG